MSDQAVLLGTAERRKVQLPLASVARHGFVAGAPGTGTRQTLQVLAEAFSDLGVPVFATDVSGELAGMSRTGRAAPTGAASRPGYPVVPWDALGTQGHPLRPTAASLGPLLLSRMLGLNDTQEAVLTVVFRVAHENDLLLLDTKDLRSMLKYAAEHAADISTTYGSVSAATVGTVQRALLQFEERGGLRLLGEPQLDIADLLAPSAPTPAPSAPVHLPAADRLVTSRHVYSALVLWLLTQLRDHLPEAATGTSRPALVVLIDDAHLLFEDAPAWLTETVEQLLRSLSRRNMGVFFATENPVDLPERVLCHLGNRVQHALRDYTPRDERRVIAAAELLRPNPAFLTEVVLTALNPGEALVSVVEPDGTPAKAVRTRMGPPQSHVGPLGEDARRALRAASPLAGRYEQAVDRESAYEVLKVRFEAAAAERAAAAEADAAAKAALQQARVEAAQARATAAAERAARAARTHNDRMMEAAGKSAARSIGSQVARALLKVVLGAALKTGASGG